MSSKRRSLKATLEKRREEARIRSHPQKAGMTTRVDSRDIRHQVATGGDALAVSGSGHL